MVELEVVKVVLVFDVPSIAEVSESPPQKDTSKTSITSFFGGT